MADKYNPNFPQSVGMEWPATRGGTETVDHTREVGPQILSTVTSPVTGIGFDFTRAVQPPSGFKQHVLFNVYPSLAAITGVGVVNSVVKPVFTGTTTGSLAGGAGSVQGALASPSDTEYIALDAAEQARLRFAIDLTGKRILKIQFDVLFSGNAAAVATSGLTLRFVDAAGAVLGTDICKMDVNTLDGSADAAVRTFTLTELDINTVDTSAGVLPKPWLDTTTDLMETTACQLELSHTFGGSAGAVIRLGYVACRVYYCDETRVAVAGYEVHPSPDNYFTATPVFVTPGGGTWQKQAGQTYYVTTRVGFPQGPVINYEPLFSNFTSWAPLSMYWLAADEDPPMASYVFKRDPVTAVPTVGERVTRVHQAIFDEPSGDVDSVSYIALRPFTVSATGVGTSTTGTASQELVSSGLPGLSYTTCRVLARRFGDPPGLDVSINGFLRGTLTGSLFETFEERDDGWRLVTVPFSPAVTGAAIVNYKLASNRAAAGDSWQVLGYTCQTGSEFDSQEGTYSGSQIQAREGATFLSNVDLYTVLSTSAPQATGLAATVLTQALTPPTGCSPLDAGCVCAQDAAVTSLEYVSLDWTSTVITGFGYYEVQRWDCFDDWETMHTATVKTASIGLVVGSPGAPSTGDAALKSHWEGLGYLVTYINDDDAAPTSGYDLFVITGSTLSGSVSTKYDALAVPVIVFKENVWDDMRLSSAAGTFSASSAVYDLLTHAVTTGLPDPLTFTSAAAAQSKVANTELSAGAQPFARCGVDANATTGWVVETGGVLISGVAPARRVALGITDGFAATLTADGFRLIDQAIAWALGSVGSAFVDYGARIGVETKYRVRICRADGICGAWSTEQTVTLAEPTIPAYYFTSNSDPALNLAYPDVGATVREYSFPDAEEVVVQRLYGRDDQVVFRPTERRGDTFTRTLLLHSCATHPKPSTLVFKPLRDLSESPILPFLIVRDTRGNRWNASLIVPGGRERGRRTSNVFLSEVRVVEVST